MKKNSAAVAVLNQQAWWLGGRNRELGNSNGIAAYDFKSASWLPKSPTPELPEAQAGLAAAAVGSWVVAKELLAKRKALKADVSEALQNETVRAMSFAQEDGRPVKRTATLVRQEETFFVTVIRHDDEERVESSSEALHSLDDVDVYLRDHTPFILADFRAS